MPAQHTSKAGMPCCTIPGSLLTDRVNLTDDERNVLKGVCKGNFNLHCPNKDCPYFCKCFYLDNHVGALAFRNLKNLTEHFLRNHADKHYECSLCGRRFGLRKDFVAHQAMCSSVFVCQFCRKLFKSKQSLVMHNRRHHPYTQRIQRNTRQPCADQNVCTEHLAKPTYHNRRVDYQRGSLLDTFQCLPTSGDEVTTGDATREKFNNYLYCNDDIWQINREVQTIEPSAYEHQWSNWLDIQPAFEQPPTAQFTSEHPCLQSNQFSTAATMTHLVPMIDGCTSPLTSAIMMLNRGTSTDPEYATTSAIGSYPLVDSFIESYVMGNENELSNRANASSSRWSAI